MRPRDRKPNRETGGGGESDQHLGPVLRIPRLTAPFSSHRAQQAVCKYRKSRRYNGTDENVASGSA